MPTRHYAAMIVGALLFASAVFARDDDAHLGEGEDVAPEPPKKRPYAMFRREVTTTPRPAFAPVAPRRYAARKLWGTYVLTSQSALSMDKLASKKGGEYAAWARATGDEMRRKSEEALALAKRADPAWIASKGK